MSLASRLAALEQRARSTDDRRCLRCSGYEPVTAVVAAYGGGYLEPCRCRPSRQAAYLDWARGQGWFEVVEGP